MKNQYAKLVNEKQNHNNYNIIFIRNLVEGNKKLWKCVAVECKNNNYYVDDHLGNTNISDGLYECNDSSMFSFMYKYICIKKGRIERISENDVAMVRELYE